MNQAPLLLFDLGGVLIENACFDDLNAMLAQPLDSLAIRERWLASSSIRAFELGQIPAQEFAERFIAEWDIPLTPEAFLTAFISWPRGFYAGARELIASLRQRYRVGCLSNSNALHWAKFGGFQGEFDVTLSSHLIGVIKPDRAAFVRALEECDRPASEVIFFDDSRPNVLMAQSLGIRTFHVDGFQALLPVLQAEGLV